MVMDLHALVAEAQALAGQHPCADGHAWETDGGRACRHGKASGLCSQPVFKCGRCGDYDYGERGGPGWRFCRDECRTRRDR